ncbi:hypothetical protein MPSEU_000367700 [Mayamaea pseudoterrestris]|nr:hypothetical protein MPSEU_000367700 [Mayamaea pseudoterrestris]
MEAQQFGIPDHPKDNDGSDGLEQKILIGPVGVARHGVKRPASLVDVSENTNSTNESRKAYPRSQQREDDDGDDIDDEEDDDCVMDTDMTPSKLASLSRSERKRYREKKRRSDVNRGFEDLMTLLLEVDPEVRAEAEDRARRGQWKGTAAPQDDNLLSRVDLISRTVTVMRRLHEENEQRKLIIGQLIQESNRSDSLVWRRAEMRIPVPSMGATGTEDSINRLVAERAQQDVVLSRLAAQRHFLQGTGGYNLFPSNDAGRPAVLNQSIDSQGLAFLPNDMLSLLHSNRALPPVIFGSGGLGQGVGVGDLNHVGLSDPLNHVNSISRDLLQQLTSTQLQQLLREISDRGSNFAPGPNQDR